MEILAQSSNFFFIKAFENFLKINYSFTFFDATKIISYILRFGIINNNNVHNMHNTEDKLGDYFKEYAHMLHISHCDIN